MHSEHDDPDENTKIENLTVSNEHRLLNYHTEYLSNYSLTIGEASSLMHSQRCKFASNRKVQRMCKEGRIDCWKLSTTRNGQPVSEWLVNETSLRNHIEKNEVKWDDAVANSSPATLRASGDANGAPDGFGNASQNTVDDNKPVFTPDALAMPSQNGSASGDTKTGKSQVNAGEDMAMPNEDGDATAKEIGETRSLASLLIENAKLTAELEGKRELETEMRDEKLFLREELKEARAGRKDVAAIAERMLETLETIAIGGKLMSGSNTNGRDRTAPVSNSQSRIFRKAENPNDENESVEAKYPISPELKQPSQTEPPKPENPFYI